MEDTLPTYDQYCLISNSCLKDNYSKNVLKKCFPFLSDRSEDKVGQDRVTVKPPVQIGRLLGSGLKVFNAGEYAMISEAFEAIKSKEGTFEAAEVFSAPLVIDWDQNLIANDEYGVNNILSKYRSK